jgi:hypothetical protein
VLLTLAISLGLGCTSRRPASAQEAESTAPSSRPTAVEGLATPESGADSASSFAAPSVESLTDPARSPYVHNPVTWQYRVVRYAEGEATSDVLLAMTTTAERQVVDGLGLAFKLVVDIAGPGPISRSLGVEVPHLYQSRVALLTPSGLYLSGPNPPGGEEAPSLHALARDLVRLGPSWPLPGTLGCQSDGADFELPIGRVHGLRTVCRELDTYLGVADVTTVWSAGVGFIYREIHLAEGASTSDLLGSYSVQRDFLVGGDVSELVAPATGDDVEVLAP